LPYPRAATWGRKGKIERFYWREITRTYHEYAQRWLAEQGETVRNIIEFQQRFPERSKSLRKDALQYWQQRHRVQPKYDVSESTQRKLHEDVEIAETVVCAPYVQVARGSQRLGKWRNSSGALVSAETVAMESYESEGWDAHPCERKLISTLYSVLCFLVVQDPRDAQVVIGYRNSTRQWTRSNPNTGVIAIPLPQDFGSREHFERRRAEYARLFRTLSDEPLSERFEEWIGSSESLRDYLWVNDDSAVELARLAIRTVPSSDILRWVEWAAGSFWKRQPGWPDLLLTRDGSYRFVEVKSPHDELSQEQIQWFRWAKGDGQVPCEICRVRKSVKELDEERAST